MLRFTSAVATVAACLLPTLAIGVLTTARNMTETLLYIGGFTVLFSIGLMVLTTDASRMQIFTATAAYVHFSESSTPIPRIEPPQCPRPEYAQVFMS